MNEKVRDGEGNGDEEKEQHEVDAQVPAKVAGTRVHEAHNFEDDQLKHGAREGDDRAEDDLHPTVVDLLRETNVKI